MQKYVPSKDSQLIRLAHARLWIAEARLATCQAALDEIRRNDHDLVPLDLVLEGVSKADDAMLALCQLVGSLSVHKDDIIDPLGLPDAEPPELARIYAQGVGQMVKLALDALSQVSHAVGGAALVREDLLQWMEPWAKLQDLITVMFPPVPREEEIPY